MPPFVAVSPSHRSVVGSVVSAGGLCHPSPCHNGGSCESHDGVFTCYCPPGFAGSLCQHDLTKSRYVPMMDSKLRELSIQPELTQSRAE